jgi:L,D-transpeptidase ErfK/SrfK
VILLLLVSVYGSSLANDRVLISTRLVGSEFTYKVEKGDSLTSVAARFGVELAVLAKENGLASNSLLKEGQQLRIDNRHVVPQADTEGILVNIPQRMLFYWSNGNLVGAYPLALGRANWPTPTGHFRVVGKEKNPTWDVPKSIQEEMRREGKEVVTQVPPCPQNPLGRHWIATSMPAYGIHGTNAPTSIYQFRTHGCIRLHPDDIADLFDRVRLGSPGLIVYKPLLLAKIDDQLFLEVHRDVYGKEEDPLRTLLAIVAAHNLESLLDWAKAKAIIEKQEGLARNVTKAVDRNPHQ